MLVTLKDIKKIIGGNMIFDKLCFEVKPGEKLGLVGRNGSGKTTIFKLITKIEEYEQGDIYIKKGTKVGYLEQMPLGFTGTMKKYLLSSMEDIIQLKARMSELEMEMQSSSRIDKILKDYGEMQERFTAAGGYEIDAQIDKIANGLQIGHLLEQPFSSLSGGEKTKAGLAKILLQNPDLLLLDEPTNHLDLSAIEWLEDYICQYQGAVCIISHDRSFLDNCIGKIADLENGEITYYAGNYSAFVQQKEEKLLNEFAAFQEQQKKIKKMKEAIKRLKLWANQANPPNEGLHKRARNMERALERMEKLDKPVIDPVKMKLDLGADHRTGKDVIRAESITKRFGSRQVLKELDLHLRYQDRLAVVGDNGSGKSTLVNILLGIFPPDSGTVHSGTQLEIGYLSQHPFLEENHDKQLIDYFREEVRVTEEKSRHILAKFMFYGFSVFKKLGQLSGGESMRLKLAVFMYKGVNVLFLDEPTNHLDIDSQEVLEEALDHYDGTVLCISHDRYFLNKCFSETAYLYDGKLHRYPGNYQVTRDKWEALKKIDSHSSKSAFDKQTKKKPVSHIDYEKRIIELEDRLAKLEERQQAGDPEQVRLAKKQLEERLEAYYAKWLNEQQT
ncbi:ribosomal protection-like ABC-F family protein [Sediminibacillus albus]|uniref:ATPase components of ABC transporters with duplicated ATPase domains n=1 Tax=Sediminibacillus albus TaxID=407036 RepID=A0A1G9AU31_9BACI|nr:ABC-F family ATP-binding cassette domain-containing protein [Sediminibacillus albus]SDK30791.1 ATPase components of ABC transporters with duplicated ATPase domains [Sediminibacillus albus]